MIPFFFPQESGLELDKIEHVGLLLFEFEGNPVLLEVLHAKSSM